MNVGNSGDKFIPSERPRGFAYIDGYLGNEKRCYCMFDSETDVQSLSEEYGGVLEENSNVGNGFGPIQSVYDEMSYDVYCYAIESRSIARPVVPVNEGDNSSDENESIAVSVSDGPDENKNKSSVHDDGSDKNKNKSSARSNKTISIAIVLVVGVLVV